MKVRSGRKKIEYKGETVGELMRKYGISRATAFRARRRGYFWVNYHVREINVDMREFPVENAIRIAKAVFCKHFYDWWEEKEDLIQEALLRMLETSGVSKDGYFMWRVAMNAMYGYVKSFLLKGR